MAPKKKNKYQPILDVILADLGWIWVKVIKHEKGYLLYGDRKWLHYKETDDEEMFYDEIKKMQEEGFFKKYEIQR